LKIATSQTVWCNCMQAWTIDYWLNKARAPKEKVIVGISTYGTTFTLANTARHGLKAASTGPGKAGKYTQEPGTLAYYEVRAVVAVSKDSSRSNIRSLSSSLTVKIVLVYQAS